MARQPKPSDTQRKILRNLAAGRAAFYGRPGTQSHAAGWGCSLDGARRRGWVEFVNYFPQITDAGRAAIADEAV